MIDDIITEKGYMIRELHAVADIAGDAWYDAADLVATENWPINSAAKGMGGWWGGITVTQMTAHLNYVQQQIDAKKLTVYTVSELTKYRMTANEALAGTVNITEAVADKDYDLTVTPASDIAAKYKDEISVIVSLPVAADSLGVNYKTVDDAWGMSPRRRPRKMDDAGKVWSVSVQPYLGTATIVVNGVWNGQGEETEGNPTSVGQAPVQAAKAAYSFAGMQNGQVSLNLPAGNYTANLFNVQGRMISTVNINALGGMMPTGLRTTGLSKGIYFLQLNNGGAGVFQHKLMVR